MTGKMDLAAGIGYALVALWLVFLAAHVAREIAAARKSSDPVERAAYRALLGRMAWRGLAVVVWVGVVFGGKEDWPIFLPTQAGIAARWIGIALALGGIALQAWARRTLGQHYSALLTTRPDHKMVREGPYRWVRHPIYSGFAVMFIGLSLALNSWMFFWLMAIPQTALFVAQILYEEPLLVQRLGNEYRIYQQEVPALFPRLGRRPR